MNEEQMPGTSSADQNVNRRWREQSAEEPSSLADARIRAAARQVIANDGTQSAARSSAWWSRFVPLAAAASVALLAVGLVRLIPHQEYQARPVPDVTRQGEAHQPASSLPAERELPAERGAEPSPVLPMPPHEHPDADARESTSRRERAHAPEPLRAPTLEQASGLEDETATRTDTPDAPDRNSAPRTAARPVEAFGVAPRAKASAPAADSAASAADSEAVRRSFPAAPARAIPETLAAQVSDDAARRTGADPATIRIVAVEPTAWPDSSLGCDPQGEHAGGARVPGYLVTVQAPGTTLRYHTDDSDRIAVCEGE